ncbi:acyl carrier protein [Catenulispora yoronensis]|uniref:acyl carrier protein n=1 Tax=Catenulispora yoronensis TaxID=450799 RepID=UPI0031D03FF2
MDGTEVNEQTVAFRLRALVAEQLHQAAADTDWDTATLADLGLDSMTAIELVLAIEDTFGVPFPEDLLVRETFSTLAELAAIVEAMIEAP